MVTIKKTIKIHQIMDLLPSIRFKVKIPIGGQRKKFDYFCVIQSYTASSQICQLSQGLNRVFYSGETSVSDTSVSPMRPTLDQRQTNPKYYMTLLEHFRSVWNRFGIININNSTVCMTGLRKVIPLPLSNLCIL